MTVDFGAAIAIDPARRSTLAAKHFRALIESLR
jgi:hypothetical protein